MRSNIMNRRDLIIGGAVGVAAGVAGTTLLNQSNKKSELAAPSVNKERIEVAMVSTWPKDFPGLGTGAQRFAQSVTDTTDGRIQVTYYAAGERVGAFDSFDEVASGNAQMYHGADYYWKGKHPGWAYFTAVPFGMTYTEINSWMRFGGGQQLWDELAAGYGLKCLPCGNTGVQMGGWFRKEMRSASDFKGLKMRMPGLGGDVIAKLGASPVSLPGGQIYENLVSGAIDATEWVGPWNDEAMKFYEAAKYYYFPGMHEPASQLAMGFNASFWGSLSKSDQALITSVTQAENNNIMGEYNAKNGPALERLVRDQGVQVREFNDDVYDAFGEAAAEVFEETRKHSDLAARVHDSFAKARKELGSWMKISDQAYLNKRNQVLDL